MITKVMLSAKFDRDPVLAEKQMRELRFPLLSAPKIDGIRAHIYDRCALSRKNKLLPNNHVQYTYGQAILQFLDGELTSGSPTSKSCFNTTQSAVMSQDGIPEELHYHVFDYTDRGGGFDSRLDFVSKIVAASGRTDISVVPHKLITHLDDLLEYEEECVLAGWEGIMMRDPRGPYKQGRSTLREGWLIKLKRFDDSEAEILGAYEQETNNNLAVMNKVGHMKRSSHKENKVFNGHLGGFWVRDIHTGVEFNVGTMLGITKEMRKNMWDNFSSNSKTYLGLIIKYKSQSVGAKDKPRIPIMIGFRNQIDT